MRSIMTRDWRDNDFPSNSDDELGSLRTVVHRDSPLVHAYVDPRRTPTLGRPRTGARSSLAITESSPLSFESEKPQPTWARSFQLALKRAIDFIGAGLGLLLLAPLLIGIAILIKGGSRGPVFFRQSRTGRDNSSFEILKFRSMYTDRCDISGVAQTIKDDTRVTPIGRVLRRTNLDELPQLLNVLKGDMSLVGPRPHVPGMLAAGVLYEDLVPNYAARHILRPGITGLAQVNGLRGPTTERQPAVDRVLHDLRYVREFSLWLDFKILVMTIISELRGGTGT
jgi:lipopolysaccharide/colanic/teichoic acid biosynthesis glycosyltransferase